MRLRTMAFAAVAALAISACGGGGSDDPTTGEATSGDTTATAPATDQASGTAPATDEGSGTAAPPASPGADVDVPDSPDNGVTADSITIGWMGDLTGPTVAAQGLVFDGAEAAVDWYNQNGGVVGRQLRMVEKDDQYGAEVAATNYASLVNDEKMLALLNVGGAHITTALVPNLDSDGIPLVLPAQTIDAQLESEWIFNGLGHYGDQADVAVAFMGDRLGDITTANVAVVHLEVPSGVEWATYIQSEVEEAGGSFAGSLPLNTAAPDYAGTVTRLKDMVDNGGVNFVAFHASPAQALGLGAELASQGVTVPVVGIQGIAASSVYTEGPPQAAEQMFGIHSFLPPLSTDCEWCTVIQDHVAGTDWEDAASEANFSHGWLQVAVTVQAIERAAAETGEVTRVAVRDALRGSFEVGGLTCPIDWTDVNHSPCSAPFQFNAEAGLIEVIDGFDAWSDALDGEYGLFEG